MERSWKITFTVLLAAIIILLLMNLRQKDNRIDNALRKLDSTKMLLGITLASVDSSQKYLTDLQNKITTYDIFLSSLNSSVNNLTKSFKADEANFNLRKEQAKKKYSQTKDSLLKYNRHDWPAIVIDTSR
ncbi:MAG: hypothetical protein H0W62_05160 [Chitinophagales bacterium]|nr:hypothetical protein [Chitinophagales bacterium]